MSLALDVEWSHCKIRSADLSHLAWTSLGLEDEPEDIMNAKCANPEKWLDYY